MSNFSMRHPADQRIIAASYGLVLGLSSLNLSPVVAAAIGLFVAGVGLRVLAFVFKTNRSVSYGVENKVVAQYMGIIGALIGFFLPSGLSGWLAGLLIGLAGYIVTISYRMSFNEG